MRRMNKLACAVLIFLLGYSVYGEKFWEKKPYTKWTEKEAREILKKSPWCYEFKWAYAGDIGDSIRFGGNSERDYITIFRMALFSAKVVRQAYVSVVAKGDDGKFRKYRDFATRDFDEIVIAMTLDSIPRGISSVFDIQTQLEELRLPDLANNTFLATNTGKKVFIKDYIPPTPDGTGAKFVFPRSMPDGSPFLTDSEKSFKFQTIEFRIKEQNIEEVLAADTGRQSRPISETFAMGMKKLKSGEVAIDATFKVSKMKVDGKIDF